MKKKPPAKSGVARIWAALFYSLDGLGLAFKNEAAFRQEVVLCLVLGTVLLFLPISMLFKALLFFATIQVLIVELLNSAIESVVDLAAPEFHELAKRAKDMGSAAVLISLLLAGGLWMGAVFRILSG